MVFYCNLFEQLEFYERFMKDHPSCQIGLRTFENLKPNYVRRFKEQNTYLCKYHVEMVELMHGFNNMWFVAKGLHGQDCSFACDVC
jgi:hypothetical protein